MSATLASAKVTVIVNAILSQIIGLQNSQAVIDNALAVSLATGVGLNQADLIYSATPTIAASGNLILDLAGSLKDAFNNSVNFARLKAIIVIPALGNTNNVLVGGAGSNPFIGPFGSDGSAIIQARPGGMLAMVAPDAVAWPVVATTGDQLEFANSGSGTGVTFGLVLIGASA